jgi:hypothetical protein
MDAAPLKGFNYIFLCSVYISGLVSIFNPQQEIAPVLFGKKVIKKGCPHTTHV